MSLVVILALVPTLVIAYIHTDQEWAATAHAIVFLQTYSRLMAHIGKLQGISSQNLAEPEML